MSDRLQQLAIFVRAVETGSFSRVAREFGLSQPSVSRTVAALEERLGVKLLTRTTASSQLPMRARRFCPVRARHLPGSKMRRTQLEERTGCPAHCASRCPRLTACSKSCRSSLNFLARHPQLKIDLMMSDRYENLIAEGADMALRHGDQPDSSFVARKLASTRRLFVASPAYLACRGTPKTLAELGNHHLIGGPTDPNDQNWTARWKGVAEVQPVDIRVRARSAAGAMACASARLGIAIASIWMCAQELASGALAEVLAGYQLDPANVFVVFPAGRHPSPKARAFRDYLVHALAKSGRATSRDRMRDSPSGS